MVKIPSFVHVLVGIVMIIFSTWIEGRADNTNLIFFKVIGGGFIAYGFWYVVKGFITKDENVHHEEDSKTFNNEMNNEKKIIRCKKCGTKHYDKSNYCHMCGLRLK